MNNAAREGLTRRALLAAGGSLVVAFSLRPQDTTAQEPGAQGPKSEGPTLPGSLDKTPMLDAWIRIGADGKVTVFSGKDAPLAVVGDSFAGTALWLGALGFVVATALLYRWLGRLSDKVAVA